MALGQILPHITIDGMIVLGDLLALIQLLEATFGNLYRVATVEWKIHNMIQNNCKFAQCYAGFSVIAGNLVWNSSGLMNALRIRLPEEREDSFQNKGMPEELVASNAMCKKGDNQNRQCQVEQAVQNTAGGTGSTSSPKSPNPQCPWRIPQ